MGGDHAPAEILSGAALAAADGINVILIGPEAQLRRQLATTGAGDAIQVVHASEWIGMDEDPALGLRAKPDATIRVACRHVADGHADAVVSAGSTGATLAAAVLTLGRLPGVRRPVVGAVIPVRAGEVVLVDAGASMEVQPEQLPGYARMASAYAEIRGVDSPRIGLLNVGEEPGKGNALARDGYEALRHMDRFAGNVEPGAVLRGDVDVVVADGFSGNIFLKTVEAMGSSSRGDSAALLLGIAGEVLVAHGAARASQVAGAIRAAADVARAGLSQRLGALLAPEEQEQPT